jgi:hypothetical protein
MRVGCVRVVYLGVRVTCVNRVCVVHATLVGVVAVVVVCGEGGLLPLLTKRRFLLPSRVSLRHLLCCVCAVSHCWGLLAPRDLSCLRLSSPLSRTVSVTFHLPQLLSVAP